MSVKSYVTVFDFANFIMARLFYYQIGRNLPFQNIRFKFCYVLLVSLPLWFAWLSDAHAQVNQALSSNGGSATQSSSPYGSNYSAGRAINNNTGDTSHTGTENEPWLDIDLGEVIYIDSLEMWNRNHETKADRLRDFYIFISDNAFTEDSIAGSQAQSGVTTIFFSCRMGRPSTMNVI